MPMLLDELKSIVGASGWTMDALELAPHLSERRGRVRGRALIMLSPRSTAEVSAIVRACASAGVAIVTQGGNTGLCGGAIPDNSGSQVLLSMARLNRIRHVDTDDFSMIVEAGCILANVQQAAREAGLVFPLSLSAEGSCQIGGNLATNAGGVNVIRYGTARQQVLGIEVVLADGKIWDGLRSLRKDTAGYDMKQVFIGSEGTLGIITAATLRLMPPSGTTHTALIALPSAGAAVRLMGRVRGMSGDQVQAFELISQSAMQLALRYSANCRSPFGSSYPWVVLMEIASAVDSDIATSLAAVVDECGALDAVTAKNTDEARQLWRIRHAIPDAQIAAGASLKHDISLPISRLDEFLQRSEAMVLSMLPGAMPIVFGHVGDGNLHYNISQAVDADAAEFLRQGEAASDAIYALVHELGGSFSAEHGVGVLKKALLEQYRSTTELELMRTLKRALDPENRLNPGKVI
ncbi:MAG: FAD-binding oxidoreductase [Gammaproteobacteria bacterium]|nr:FAD-binding oxidoreductase [Gammaproteobacteria bacterium]